MSASATPKQPEAEQLESKLQTAKHVTYWKRCLKTYLPSVYVSSDSNRLMLAYFCISALDLLDALDSSISDEERRDFIDWVYICQHAKGGFRGSPGVDLDGRENLSNEAWDVSSGPATFFALSILAILRDDFSRVKRKGCLQFLNRIQRPDGSIGEHLGENGTIEGGMDTRFGYCGAGARWILRGKARGEVEGVPDIEVDKLIHCINLAQVWCGNFACRVHTDMGQTFDGGISEMPFHEPHGELGKSIRSIVMLIKGSRIHLLRSQRYGITRWLTRRHDQKSRRSPK